MAKASSKGSSNKARQLEPFDKRSINLAKFKPDLTAKDFKALFPPVGGIITFPFFPIETLTCTKTIGLSGCRMGVVLHPSPLPPDSDIAIKLGRRGVG